MILCIFLCSIVYLFDWRFQLASSLLIVSFENQLFWSRTNYNVFYQVAMGADHRIVDGATVARFCNEWKHLVENPELMLLHMTWTKLKTGVPIWSRPQNVWREKNKGRELPATSTWIRYRTQYIILNFLLVLVQSREATSWVIELKIHLLIIVTEWLL